MAASPSPTTLTTPPKISLLGPTLEQQRIALLLEINASLLTEVSRLQGLNQGGAVSAQHALQLKKVGQPDRPASEEYANTLRRIQGNLAYLMPKAQQNAGPEGTQGLVGPAYMTAPPHMPELKEVYARLGELFPGWKGLEQRAGATAVGNSTQGVVG